MNEGGQRFEVQIMDQEELLQNQQRRSEQVLDFFNVEEIEKRCETLDETGCVYEIERTFDLFLEKDKRSARQYTLDFWKIILESEDPFIVSVKERAQKMIKDDSDNLKMEFTMFAMKDTLRNRTMPTKTWLNILRSYKQKIENFNNNLQEMTPEIKSFVIKSFIEHINPDLEDPKSEKELIDILENIKLQTKDPLNTQREEGMYTGADRTIELDMSILSNLSEGLSKEAWTLIVHECLHAITSGKIAKHTLIRTSDADNTTRLSSTHAQWSGLEMTGFMVQRFSWLNEAITETLAAQATRTEPSSYPEERELIALLLSKGKNHINPKILTNAYFEKKGYQTDKKEGHIFWKRLINEFQQSFDHDSHFLIKLDILIQNKGIDEALTFMKNWDPQNPTQISIREIEGRENDKKYS